ncbi:MAG: hypothetical protein KDK33_21115, partial [Leptospiraceae bacterium]|nr:hypothetical protein [Leptospiraceae bacterium]
IDIATRDLKKKCKERGFNDPEEVRKDSLTSDALNDHRVAWEQWDRSMDRVQTNLKTVDSELQGQKLPDLESTASALQGLQQTILELQNALEADQTKQVELGGVLQQKAKLRSRLEELRQSTAALVQLADDLTGRNNRRVHFETFILHYYLQEVARHANQRLHRLSDGRYQL